MSSMATVTATATETIPRTANLLACKQWWRVCFLYGDQEKYYRQIYGKAASQRLAASEKKDDGPNGVADSSSDTTTTTSGAGRFGNGAPTLFPAKQPSRRRSKMNASERLKQSMNGTLAVTTTTATTAISSSSSTSSPSHRKEDIKPHRKITVLDDPFLFGMNEHANLSEDSGIDNAAFDSKHSTAPPPLKPRKIQRQFHDIDLNRDLCNDLKINENELRLLHLSRRNRCGVAITAPGGLINESFSYNSESEEQHQQRNGQGSPSSSSVSGGSSSNKQIPPQLSPRRRNGLALPNGTTGTVMPPTAKE